MIADAHAHTGDGLGRAWTPERLVAMMNRYGIQRAYISSMDALLGDPSGNQRVLQQYLRPYPERFLGYCVANPHQTPLKEVRHCIDAGFVGIKLHPAFHEYRLDGLQYAPVLQLAHAQCRPVLVHSGGSLGDPDRFAPPEVLVRVAKRYPEMSLIIGHMGMERWRDIVELAMPFPNVYLEICSSLPQRDRLSTAIQRVGAERIVFGTDMPLLEPAVSLGLVEGAHLARTERERILGGNITRILERVRE